MMCSGAGKGNGEGRGLAWERDGENGRGRAMRVSSVEGGVVAGAEFC